ncbi:MAG: hypothetical protein RIT17_882, partial [Pseudomonadota bacterium]
ASLYTGAEDDKDDDEGDGDAKSAPQGGE